MRQTVAAETYTGLISKYIASRGFGFLRPDASGNDVFFHVRECRFDEDLIQAGQPVSYSLADDEGRGPRAVSVRLVEQEQ